jgi:hypothetical protein
MMGHFVSRSVMGEVDFFALDAPDEIQDYASNKCSMYRCLRN